MARARLKARDSLAHGRSDSWGGGSIALAALFTAALIAPAPFYWCPPAWIIRLL